MKKVLRVVLILIITIICVLIGLRTRYNNGINVTQFETLQNGAMAYMIETRNNQIVMIDGGRSMDTEHIENAILEKGGVVDAWFITHAQEDHFGVLRDVINSGKVQVNNIYVSLNSNEWYEENVEENKDAVIDFLNLLDSENVRDKVHELSLREEITIDNLFFKILKIKNPEYVENAENNQSVVIKVSNNIRSMIFLGDLGSEYEEQFLADNVDEIQADAVQMAHHGQRGVSEKVYQAINPKMCFWPATNILWTNDPEGDGTANGPWTTLETRSWIEKIGAENYVANNGDITVNIH